MHKPQVETDLVVTSGSQDGLCKAIEMMMEEGDPVSYPVFPSNCYSSILLVCSHV